MKERHPRDGKPRRLWKRMTAIACLRVSLDANRTEIPAEALGPLVAKYTTAFLEVRWAWPRHSSALSHYCYLLTDPRADTLDPTEVARLSEELEQRLFGTGAEKMVTLLLFEGSEAAIREFTALSEEALAAVAAGEREMPEGGRLSRISPDGALDELPPPLARRHAPPPGAETAPPDETLQGIYFPRQQLFVGDVLACTPHGSSRRLSLVEGGEHLPEDVVEFDNACVLAARRMIDQKRARAPLYLPVCFTKLMRPTLRAGYAELLWILPPEARAGLAATVYGVPRVLSYQALRIVHATLDEHFASIDLQTADPGFEVLQLANEAVRSVTLVLPDARQDVRLAALRRFGARADEFRRRRIWTGVTNVRTRKERDLALELEIPFLTGPAICRAGPDPVGGMAWAWDRLPAPVALAEPEAGEERTVEPTRSERSFL